MFILSEPLIKNSTRSMKFGPTVAQLSRNVFFGFSQVTLINLQCMELLFDFFYPLPKKSDDIHTGKCIRRFAGIYAHCRYFIDRKWSILELILYRKTCRMPKGL